MYTKHKNHVVLSLMLGIGVLLSFLLFSWLHKNELEFAQEKFSQLINRYATAVEYALQEETHSLNALAAFHYASENITADEFKTFASTILKYHPNVQALEWVPEVLHEHKKEYEKDFSFQERDRLGNMIPARERSVYYPVYFLEPFSGNEKALGFDIGSEKIRLEALTRAKLTENVVASAPIRLVQAKKEESAMIIFQPIYEQRAEKRDFIGFYLNVIRTEALIENMIFKVSKECQGVNMNVYDIDSNDSKKLFYSKKCTCSSKEVPDIKVEKSVEFAGREWQLHAVATQTFLSHYMTIYPYLIFAISVILTILISFIFYQIQKGYQVVTESNEQLRRFQKLAVGREQRISELKKENLELKNFKEDSNAK